MTDKTRILIAQVDSRVYNNVRNRATITAHSQSATECVTALVEEILIQKATRNVRKQTLNKCTVYFAPSRKRMTDGVWHKALAKTGLDLLYPTSLTMNISFRFYCRGRGRGFVWAHTPDQKRFAISTEEGGKNVWWHGGKHAVSNMLVGS